jgi:hypothetical protein
MFGKRTSADSMPVPPIDCRVEHDAGEAWTAPQTATERRKPFTLKLSLLALWRALGGKK